MSDIPTINPAPLGPRRLSLRAWLAHLVAAQAEEDIRWRSLEKLAGYDDRLLDDIGLTRKQAKGQHSWPAWVVADPWGR